MDRNTKNHILALGTMLFETEMKMRAVTELLVEKRIISVEEFEEKYKVIEDRDFEKIKAELNDIIEEYAKKTPE